MHAFVRCLEVAGIGAVLSGPITASLAADQGVTCTGLPHAEKRVLEQSYQGVDALRRYVIITRPVHGLTMVDVVESIDAWRAKAQCAKSTAADAVAPAVSAVAQARN